MSEKGCTQPLLFEYRRLRLQPGSGNQPQGHGPASPSRASERGSGDARDGRPVPRRPPRRRRCRRSGYRRRGGVRAAVGVVHDRCREPAAARRHRRFSGPWTPLAGSAAGRWARDGTPGPRHVPARSAPRRARPGCAEATPGAYRCGSPAAPGTTGCAGRPGPPPRSDATRCCSRPSNPVPFQLRRTRSTGSSPRLVIVRAIWRCWRTAERTGIR